MKQNTKAQQNEIKKENRKIEEAILVSRLLETPAGKIIVRDILKMEKTMRNQDIFGIKKGGLEEAKGKCLGLHEVGMYFEEIEKLAVTPRKDPITGEKEVMSEKK